MVKTNFSFAEEIKPRVQLIHNLIFYHAVILFILFFSHFRTHFESWFFIALALLPLGLMVRVYFVAGKNFYFSFWTVFSLFLIFQLFWIKPITQNTSLLHLGLYLASLVCFLTLLKFLINPLFYQMTYRWALNKQRYGMKVEISNSDKIHPGRIYTKGKEGYLISFENLPLAQALEIKFENGSTRSYTLLTKRIESYGDQIFYGIRRQ